MLDAALAMPLIHSAASARLPSPPRSGIEEVAHIDNGPAGRCANCVGVQVSQNGARMHDLSADRTAHERAVKDPREVKYDKPSSTSLSNVTQGPGLARKRIKRIEQVRESERIASQREEQPYCIPAMEWRNSAK